MFYAVSIFLLTFCYIFLLPTLFIHKCTNLFLSYNIGSAWACFNSTYLIFFSLHQKMAEQKKTQISLKCRISWDLSTLRGKIKISNIQKKFNKRNKIIFLWNILKKIPPLSEMMAALSGGIRPWLWSAGLRKISFCHSQLFW